MNKMLAVLQARTSSSRLPGKVLKPILGQPMLFRQIERVRATPGIDELLVATSDDPSDDALAAACLSEGVPCFRGSLDDVLDRFYRAAASRRATDVVRLTGDCPLADRGVIARVIDEYRRTGADYASNALTPSFPDGLDVEVMRFAALERAWKEAALPSQREHVTPFLYAHPEWFRIHQVRADVDRSALRWTVDSAADFDFVVAVYRALYPDNPDFGMDDVLALLARQPGLAAINGGQLRNEGYLKSLAKDALVGQERD